MREPGFCKCSEKQASGFRVVISQGCGVWTRKRALIFLFWAVALHSNLSPSVSTIEGETRVFRIDVKRGVSGVGGVFQS